MAKSVKYVAFEDAVAALKEDAEKFYDKGNGAAGKRLRKGLQTVGKLAKELRQEVSDIKNGEA